MINDDDDVLGLTQQLFEMLSIHANIYFLSIYANIYSFEHLLQYTPEPIDKCWHQEDLQSKELWQKVRFLSMPLSYIISSNAL